MSEANHLTLMAESKVTEGSSTMGRGLFLKEPI